MPDVRKIIKVFLASPGDLKEERFTAKSVVDDFNKLWSDNLGYHVELVGWEDTVAQFGRPQELINRDLDQCELFVGMLWKRWGTPPDAHGRFTSGFEEEYETSIAKRKTGNKPDVSLLFKDIDDALKSDPGPELKKVLTFREKIISEKTILFETFSDPTAFERKIRGIITTYVQRLQGEEQEAQSEKSQSPQPDKSDTASSVATSEPAAQPALSNEGAAFVRTLLDRSETENDGRPLSNVEIARFKLLGAVISTHGNDTDSLGVHDANLLFAARKDVQFGQRERVGLVLSGLENFSSENTPLWYWLAGLKSIEGEVLSFYSLGGPSESQKIGALKAMRLVRESLNADVERNIFLNSWLTKDSNYNLRAAAIEYLAECGISEDLPGIKEVYDRGEYQTQGPAIEAIIRINLRDSRTRAIAALYELQPESINEQLVDGLFGDGATLARELLERGVSHRSARVRRKVVSLLAQRNELASASASELLNDNDASVRFDALQAAAKGGRTFTEQEAKAILIKPASGAVGALAAPLTDSEGEANWARYRHMKYKAMSESELEQLAANEGIYNVHAHYALHDLKCETRASSLRAMIDDQYARFFNDKYAALAALPGIASETLAATKELEEYLRKGYTSEAFEIICKKAHPEDLGRVRKTLQSEFVSYSDAVVEYLRKYGEWQDIELLIKAVERPKYGGTLLILFSDDGRYRTVARAVFSMGRDRFAQLLTLKMSASLLSHIIVQSTDKSFRGLSNAAIESLLHSESDRVRKGAALKSVRALTKRRVQGLLDNHTDTSKRRFYNVIYWLDFGVSMPRERALSAVQRTIVREWLTGA